MALCLLDAEAPFELLAALPSELIRRILHGFCDGRSLSTFALALVSSSKEKYSSCALNLLPLVCRDRLEQIAFCIEDKIDQSDDIRNLRGAVQWIRSIASAEGKSSSLARQVRILSENAAVLDFLQESLGKFSNVKQGHFEWPVWYGQLTIDSFVTGTRMRNTARILITSPMQRPSLIPGSSLLRNRNPCSVFQSEPYNMIPIPPWGRIHGLHPDDDYVLKPVACRLEQWGQVAVPAGYANADILDVRIITMMQAKRLSPPFRPRTSWMLEAPGTPLLCCWQDDSAELTNDRDYVDYIIEMLKAKERISQCGEPSSREYIPFQHDTDTTRR